MRLDNDDPRLAATWHGVLPAAAVGATPTSAVLLGRRWWLSRDEDGLTAYDDERARPAGVAERGGVVWLAPEAATTDLPDATVHDDPAFTVAVLSRRTRVSAGVLTDNFLDVSHFSYLHPATFGRTAPVTVDGLSLGGGGWGVELTHTTDLHEGDPAAERAWRTATYTLLSPFVTHLRMHFAATDGLSGATLVCVPEDATTTAVHVLVAWPRGDDEGLAEQVALSAAVLAEDLRILELMADPRLELDLRSELHTRADRASVEYRRVLARYLEGVSTCG